MLPSPLACSQVREEGEAGVEIKASIAKETFGEKSLFLDTGMRQYLTLARCAHLL